MIVKNYQHTAHSLPRWKPRPGEKCPYPRVDSKGRGVFETKREIKEFEARSGGYKFDVGD